VIPVYDLDYWKARATAAEASLATMREALERAQQDVRIEHQLFLVEAEKHSEWLENYMREHKRALVAEAERTVAEVKLKAAWSALSGMLSHYVNLVNSGDAGFWDAEAEPHVIAARRALGGSNAE